MIEENETILENSTQVQSNVGEEETKETEDNNLDSIQNLGPIVKSDITEFSKNNEVIQEDDVAQ